MSDFSGYKEELDALRLLLEGHHYYDEEQTYLVDMLMHKFEDVLFYYDAIKPRHKVELPELILNYNYTLTFCRELLDTRTILGRCAASVQGGNNEGTYTDRLREIENKLVDNIRILTK